MNSSAELSATDTPSYLLAGGQSQRFQGDKARELIGGQPQLLRLKQLLERLGHKTFVVADSNARFRDLGIECLVDAKPQCGPLAGLSTALEHRLEHLGEGWILLCNCDQLQWTNADFSQLAQHANSGVCFAGVYSQGRAEPMPALYHTSLQEVVRRQLDGEDLSMQSLLRHAVEAGFSLAKVKGESPSARSFNTREELHLLLKHSREM